jgi:hypothetical protein
MDPVDDADAAPATSGTRLRARYYTGEDGSKQFIGWHDKMRDEDCSFQKAEDGQLRCLPAMGVTALYADSACKEPIFQVSSAQPTTCGAAGAAPVAVYANEYSALVCGFARVYNMGTPLQLTDVYTGYGTGACTKAVADAAVTYRALTPIASTAFVAATEQVE